MIGILSEPIVLAIACLSVLIAGISKAGFGSGASFVAAPLLALFVEPSVALAVLLPVLMVVDAVTLRPYWGRWRRDAALLLCVGALPGVLFATLVYRASDPDLIRFLIGVIALSFLAFQLARKFGWTVETDRPPARWLGFVTGALAGFTSFVSHAGGPPVTVYLLHRKLSKTEFQATTVLVFWVVNLSKAGPYAAIGLFDAAALWTAAALTPVAVFGAWLGVRAHRLVPEPLFFGLTHVLLAVAGSKLILDALT